jgi:hypothetical protein
MNNNRGGGETTVPSGYATLADLLRQLLDRLQSVMNAVARLVFSVWKYDHVTPLPRDLSVVGL